MLYAFNKGEVCTCPSRALVQESIYDEFMARCLDRIAAIKQGNPLDETTMLGPQVSAQQLSKISGYVDIGREEGAEVLIGGSRPRSAGEFANGYFYEPTVLKGHNKMRVFQEEIFGPVLAVTTFRDEAEALRIANDTLYGLGAGVWTRDTNRIWRMSHGIQAGRVWVELLPPVPRGRGVRWLQDLRHRPGEPPDDAGALQPDQERARQHRREEARTSSEPPAPRHAQERRVSARVRGLRPRDDRPAAAGHTRAVQALRRVWRTHGEVLVILSAGCCGGSAPMCFPRGEFRVGSQDVRSGR